LSEYHATYQQQRKIAAKISKAGQENFEKFTKFYLHFHGKFFCPASLARSPASSSSSSIVSRWLAAWRGGCGGGGRGSFAEDVADELLVVERARLVLVGELDHSLQLVVREVLAELVEHCVQLGAVDQAAAVLVEIAKHAPQASLPVAKQPPPTHTHSMRRRVLG